jgi:secretion/DNA translocation related CpaE-like protein
LIVTTDDTLLDDLLRLAAAGSVDVTVAADPGAVRSDWAAAPFVLVGAESAARCAALGLSRRAAVILVARPGLPDPPWRHANTLRVEHVAILPQAQSWLVDRFADHAAGNPDRARVLAVVGGSGGVGASVLATAISVTASRRGLDTLLVDSDPLGGGVDLALGWERMGGLRWPELADARGRVSPPALVDALPGAGSLAVLSFDRTEFAGVPPEAMAAALDAGRRGRDLVVVDLPRHFDEAALLALSAAERCYVVVFAELRGCAAARRVAAAAAQHCPSLAVVVRVPAPAGIRPSEVAEALDLPLAGVLPPEPRLGRAMAAGEPPARTGRGPLAHLCHELLGGLAPRHRAA